MGHSAGIHDGSVPVMAGAGLFMLGLVLAGSRIRDLPARAVLSLTGHLRTRPDPWLEGALRSAFAEFDRELAAVLHDTSHPARPARPLTAGSPSGPPR